MRYTMPALALIVAFLTTSAHAQFTNPNSNNGYTITRPGGPTTFVNPSSNGGYVATTPGYGTSFANPNGSGGYIVTSPSQRPYGGGQYSNQPYGGQYGR